MKTKLCAVAVATGLLCSANTSFAGEGGVAAAISVHIDTATGMVDFTSAAMAVGKTTAYAISEAGTTYTAAIAVGTGGALTIDTEKGYVSSVAEESAASLATAQANTLTETINIDADAGTIDYSP